MHFQYPAFLWALALLAVPVIIHLFDFRRAKTVAFPSLRFLKHIEQRSASTRKLRDRLILTSRLLALASLILAFAKPFIARKNSPENGEANIISIYLDNSRSMEAVGPNGRLLDEARTKAKQLAEAYGLNDRFQLLTADFEGKHQRLVSRDEFLTALDEVKTSALSRTLPQIQQRQNALLKQQNSGARTAYIISDFQQNMRGSLAVDSGIETKLVPLTANPLPNISIDSAWFASPVHQPGQAEQLVIRLKNNADKPAAGVPVKFIINKQQKAIASLSLKAREQKTDTLRFSGLQAGWQQGQVQISDYPITFDDTLYTAFRVRQALPVLSLDEQKPNPFVKAAFSTDVFFGYENQPAGQVNYAKLNTYSLVVLSDATSVSTGLGQQLKTYIQQGGSVVFSPSAEAKPADVNPFLSSLGAESFSALKKQQTRVSSVNTRHHLFTGVFESVPKNMDLPLVKAFFGLNQQSRTNRQTLIEMDGRQPMLMRYGVGKGSFYLFTVPLTDSASNLPRHALFVPVLYRMAMLGLKDAPLFYTLGTEQPVLVDALSSSEKEPPKLSNGKISIIPEIRTQNEESVLFTGDQLVQPGLYSLQQGSAITAWLAFNTDRKESDMSYMGVEELGNMVGKVGEVVSNTNVPLSRQLGEANSGVALWKLCLLLALVFLTAEMMLIRFMSGRKLAENPTR